MKQFRKAIKKITAVVLTIILLWTAISSGTLSFDAKAFELDEEIEAHENDGYYEYNFDFRELNIYGNVDSSIINNFVGVEWVNFHDAFITEFSFEGTRVMGITFENCNIMSAKFTGTENIASLTFTSCRFDNLNSITSFRNAVDISFTYCEIGSLNGIEKMDAVTHLYISDVGIDNIAPISGMDSLSLLSMTYTCVSDLTPLENTNIASLDISNSMNITNLDSLMKMENLESFYSTNCEMAYTEKLYNYLNNNSIEHDIEYEELKICEQVKEIADEIIDENMAEKEKSDAIIQYVVDNIEYDYVALEDEELCTEYNLFALKYALQGIGVCRNYSALTNVLMLEAGINCYEIGSGDHIWNLVELDNEFYWLDTTWLDDGSDDIKASPYYMNKEYDFVDHDEVTVLSSFYNLEHNIQVIEFVEFEDEVTDTTKDEVFKEDIAKEEAKQDKEDNDTTENELETKEESETNMTVVIISVIVIIVTVIFLGVLIGAYTKRAKESE